MRHRAFVTGIGIVSPLGLDACSTWDAAVAGTAGVGRITSFDPQGFETQIAAEVKGFDPFAHLDRKDARRFDRFSQFAVVAAGEAIRHAGLDPAGVDPYSVAVLLGTGVGGTTSLAAQMDLLTSKGPSKVSPFLGVHMLSDMAAAIVSMHFGFKGLSCALTSACSSGADALGAALRLIRCEEAEIAITGGTEAAICPLSVASFGIMGALSRRNDDPPSASRPFDLDRDGFVMGEGAAVLVLESEASVQRRRVRPLAEFAGYGATSDAYHVSAPDPEAHGAARAIQRALADAGIRPEDVDYINAHGTSTPLNDKTETLALKAVFGEGIRNVAVSSTKSMTGHLLGAAGALESALCVQAIQNGIVLPTINLSHPDPECDLDYTPLAARRRPISVALNNSFGFGGHNAVLVFREASEYSPHTPRG